LAIDVRPFGRCSKAILRQFPAQAILGEMKEKQELFDFMTQLYPDTKAKTYEGISIR
jgi:ASC-1-like (ASCH) protein